MTMKNHQLQKKFSEQWKGYAKDPDLNTIELRYQKIRKQIDSEGRGKKILDIGCADGALIAPLAAQHEVCGIEISDYLCNEARKQNIKVIQADIEEGIPLDSHTFDIVLAAEIIEHIVDTDFFLAECNRVLTKNGKLILSTPNINTLFSPLIMALFDYPPPGSSRYRSHHVHDFTLSTLRIALNNNGFRIEQKMGVAFFIPFVVGHFLKIRSSIADKFPRLSEEFIIKAVKERDVKYDEDAVIAGIQSRSVIKAMPILKWFFKKYRTYAFSALLR